MMVLVVVTNNNNEREYRQAAPAICRRASVAGRATRPHHGRRIRGRRARNSKAELVGATVGVRRCLLAGSPRLDPQAGRRRAASDVHLSLAATANWSHSLSLDVTVPPRPLLALNKPRTVRTQRFCAAGGGRTSELAN